MSEESVPIGHPEVILGGFPATPARVFPYRGLGHVTILPPQTLRYPLLGVKMNNTLLFALCRECGFSKSSAPCTHNEQERALTGTWTHCEIM